MHPGRSNKRDISGPQAWRISRPHNLFSYTLSRLGRLYRFGQRRFLEVYTERAEAGAQEVFGSHSGKRLGETPDSAARGGRGGEQVCARGLLASSKQTSQTG